MFVEHIRVFQIAYMPGMFKNDYRCIINSFVGVSNHKVIKGYPEIVSFVLHGIVVNEYLKTLR
jgi:hypothetical protein